MFPKAEMTNEALEGGGGGGQYCISQGPLIILEKISPIPKIYMANFPKIQKTLYPHIPKIDPSIPSPFTYLQNIPCPSMFWPISLYP